MRSALLIVLGCIELAGNIPYIRDTWRGKTLPNIASWSTLTLINAITFFAAFSAGQALNTVILSFFYVLGTGTILVLAVHKGTQKYDRFDIVFQLTAILGIVVWQVLRDPNIALGMSIIVGNLAALPLYKHPYLFPHEETWSTFAISSTVALFTLALAAHWNFASIAVPVDLVTGNGLVAALIVCRRRMILNSE